MYLTERGKTSDFIQYECMNIAQVKNTINKLTSTCSITDDWKSICYAVKKQGGSDSIDYVYFDSKNNELDCTVFIGYDNNSKSYIVWVECQDKSNKKGGSLNCPFFYNFPYFM